MFGVHMACEKGDITFSICHVTTISKSHVALWVGSSHLMSPPCYVWGPEALWKTFVLVPMSIPMPRFTNGQNKYIFAIVLEKQQEYFWHEVVLKSSHQDAFFSVDVLDLWRNYLKNTCDGVRFLVNLHITLSI